jgi:hypothetical protein
MSLEPSLTKKRVIGNFSPKKLKKKVKEQQKHMYETLQHDKA